MTTLIQTLTEQTQSLKEQYVTKCIEWAKKDFERAEQVLSRTTEQWCEYFGITPVQKTHFPGKVYFSMPTGFYNTKESKTMANLVISARSITSKGFGAYEDKIEKRAIDHYTSSIQKLAARILSKGLVEGNLSVVTGWVGVNIETVITDGTKSVKAWTIIAQGPIQQPHYRYLVK